jgi:hypothetical protein
MMLFRGAHFGSGHALFHRDGHIVRASVAQTTTKKKTPT